MFKIPFSHSNSIKTMVNHLRGGKLCAVDLAEIVTDRMSLFNDTFKAFVCFDAEMLHREARECDLRHNQDGRVGLLEGIPIGVQDIFNTVSYPTQMGSPLWRGFRPGNDARAVFNCRRQGALVAGKTETAGYATHNLNNTSNPYDVSLTTGSLSGSGAVSVALGITPAALATQSTDSIIRPASYCGVYGFKPSFGLIPRIGMLKTADSLDSIGIFCAWAEDMKPLLDSLRVQGADYPISHAAFRDEDRQGRPKERPWRIAFLKTHTWDMATEYAKEAILHMTSRLAALPGVELEEVDEPAEVLDGHTVHSIIYNKAMANYFSNESTPPEHVTPLMLGLMERGRNISPGQFLDALARQSRMAVAMDDFFSQYDAAICLATAGAAPKQGKHEPNDPSLLWTMTYLPSIAAPVFNDSKGLPFGIQLIARRYNDYKLLRLVDDLCSEGILPKVCPSTPQSMQ